MKAVILTRVSTKDQEEGYSLAAQQQRLKEYCEKRKLRVIKIFEIIESSTKGERKAFEEMLLYASSQKETVAIVADAVDRFQRDFRATVRANELIEKNLIEIHFSRENLIVNSNANSMSRFVWNASVMMAQAYVDSLRDNVKRSIDYKFRNGEWGGKAPLGYLNKRDENGKSVLVLDPVRATLIRMIFEDYAKGTDSISGDLAHKAKRWGLVNKSRQGGLLSASQIQHILKNPFYYGEMCFKGQLKPHVYDALITKELWDRCQDVMQGRTRATATRYSEKPFVFRGLLNCAVSGRVVTSDLKKGRHVYLICRDPSNPARKQFVPEQEVLNQVMAVLRSIQVPKQVLGALLSQLRASHETEQKFHKEAVGALIKELARVENSLSRLIDMHIDGSITKSEYDKKATEMKHRQTELRMRIEQHSKGRDEFRTTMESLISVASRAAAIFEGSKIEQKRQLVAFVFSNLKLKGKKLEFTLRSPFDLMVNRRTYASWLGN
jgi:site-specific DNA recombinase